MDIKGPYPLTPRKNRYLLTFIDHFSKYAEIFPIQDQSGLTCARLYASQIITRHGSGSKLVTDKVSAFMSSFFNETCRILGIQRARTSSYHTQSNDHVKRLHRTFHTALSHYVNNSYTDWDLKLPYFLLAYRATPHSTTGYSPFFLLHGREMIAPANEDLRPKVAKPTQGPEQLVESLKASLRQAYQTVDKANRRSHVANKKRYDRRAKHRTFEVGSYVYLNNPARKPGLSRKFYSVWTARIGSRQNYPI